MDSLNLGSNTNEDGLSPWAYIALAIAQIVGASISADITYVAIATIGNVFLLHLFGWRAASIYVYALVIISIVWPTAMRAGYTCDFSGVSNALSACVRRPGRAVTAACMATAAILILSATLRKDRLSRTMLRLGVNTHFLWVLFAVPTLAQSILDTTKRSALLNQGRYSNEPPIWRWLKFRAAILTSGFVRTLTRHLFSREAESTRVRQCAKTPQFLATDRLRVHDVAAFSWALCSFAAAFFI